MMNDTVLRNLDGEIARHRRGFDRVCVECFRPWPCPVRELDDYRVQYLELAGIEGTALRETERANRAEAEVEQLRAALLPAWPAGGFQCVICREWARDRSAIPHLRGCNGVLAGRTCREPVEEKE